MKRTIHVCHGRTPSPRGRHTPIGNSDRKASKAKPEEFGPWSGVSATRTVLKQLQISPQPTTCNMAGTCPCQLNCFIHWFLCMISRKHPTPSKMMALLKKNNTCCSAEWTTNPETHWPFSYSTICAVASLQAATRASKRHMIA